MQPAETLLEDRTFTWGNHPDLPCLLHPGRSRAWWHTPNGWVWHDGENVWIESDLRVSFHPLRGQVDVETSESGSLRIRSSRGDVLHQEDGRITRSSHRRREEGRDLAFVRERQSGWVLEQAGKTQALPEGPTTADRCWPWRSGLGFFWATDEWVYRQPLGGQARAIYRHIPGAQWIAGPEGAALLAIRAEIVAGAPPGGVMRDLPGKLRTDGWGLRWASDGRSFSGTDAAGQAFTCDFSALQPLEHFPCAVAGHSFAPDTGMLSDGRLPKRGLLEASWAYHGLRLAGPAGLVWDLTCGEPLFSTPVVQLGATVGTDRGWATADWESGEGYWFDPDTGTILARFKIPLGPGDWVEDGSAENERMIAVTAEGKRWSIWEDQVHATTSPFRPTPLPRAGNGWQLQETGLRVAGWSSTWELPLDAAVRVRDRVFAWNADGLLIAVPVRAVEE